MVTSIQIIPGAPYADNNDKVQRFRQTRRRPVKEDAAIEDKVKVKNDPEWGFFDTAKINVKAGDGGNGCVAMRREKGVDMGGPSGGNGGRGGSIILRCNPGLNTLGVLRRQVHYTARSGENGEGKSKHGRAEADEYIEVPPGTVVKDLEGRLAGELVGPGDELVVARGGRGGRGNKVPPLLLLPTSVYMYMCMYFLSSSPLWEALWACPRASENSTTGGASRHSTPRTLQAHPTKLPTPFLSLHLLLDPPHVSLPPPPPPPPPPPGQAFRTPRNKAPKMAEKGEPGGEHWLSVELRLVADVGFVGVPNAGKSTLLAAASNARPKIANYPFTTVVPNLGVCDLLEAGEGAMGLPGGAAGLVLADIPGLLEGAHEGVGLGLAFLR